ncbi:MAG: putative ABC transporter permease [Eubacterium sp.]|nr:putative ABC transporter permease [Eubacterium sp.]
MINTVCKYFLWFIIYSVGGWVMETLLYLIRDKKVVKRGFLFGPLCPIYGFGGCLSALLIYGRFKNVFIVFLIGTLLTSALEYITHFVMEKLFHAMWWDYSDRRFNLNGRIYLKGSILFGLGVVIIVELIQPLLVKLTDIMPAKALYIVCFIIYSILIADVATMVADLAGTANALKGIENKIIKTAQKGIDLTGEQLDNAKKLITESDAYEKTAKTLVDENPIVIRFKKRYPDFTFSRYKYILDLINDAPQENKGRKDIKLYGTADSIPEAEDEAENDENKEN